MSERAQRLRLLEALLFASAEPLDEVALKRHLDLAADVQNLLAELVETYAGRGVNLVRLAGGWPVAGRFAPHPILPPDCGSSEGLPASCRVRRSRRSPSSPITSR